VEHNGIGQPPFGIGWNMSEKSVPWTGKSVDILKEIPTKGYDLVLAKA